MQLDAPPVILRRGEPQVGFGVDLKPQPQPLGHRVFSSLGHVQAAGLPNGLLQLRLHLGLGSAQYVLDDPLAGIRVVSGGVPALPAPIAALSDISLTIGPLFAMLLASLAATQHTAEGRKYPRQTGRVNRSLSFGRDWTSLCQRHRICAGGKRSLFVLRRKFCILSPRRRSKGRNRLGTLTFSSQLPPPLSPLAEKPEPQF